MDTDIRPFADRFTTSLSNAPGLKMWLVRPLQTLLASGEPVTLDQLAARARRTVAEIREALAAMPDTEYDAEGRIIGYGITFAPTPHRNETNGRTFYPGVPWTPWPSTPSSATPPR